eukprot:2255703-Prymnesium_polylepis.1
MQQQMLPNTFDATCVDDETLASLDMELLSAAAPTAPAAPAVPAASPSPPAAATQPAVDQQEQPVHAAAASQGSPCATLPAAAQ